MFVIQGKWLHNAGKDSVPPQLQLHIDREPTGSDATAFEGDAAALIRQAASQTELGTVDDALVLTVHSLRAAAQAFSSFIQKLEKAQAHGIRLYAGSLISQAGAALALASEIVREGLYLPAAARIEGQEEEAYAVWRPLWSDPRLQDREPAHAELREDVSALVHALILESLEAPFRNERFSALHPRYGVPQTPLEHWAYQLLGLGGSTSSAMQVDWIADDVSAWMEETVRARHQATYKIGWLLLEPQAEHSGDWLFIPGLVPNDEPNLFINAREVWTCEGPHLEYGNRVYPEAQERLAAGLALAAETLPMLSEGVPLGSPVQYRLSEQQAMDLLEYDATKLEHAGFAVMLPEWWYKPAPVTIEVVYDEERPPRGGVSESPLGLEAMLQYTSRIRLFSLDAGLEELSQLLQSEAPAFVFRGRWFRLTGRERKALERFATKPESGLLTAAEAMQELLDDSGTETRAGYGGFPTVRTVRGKLRVMLEGIKTVRFGELLPQPDAFCGVLRDYQQRGFTWLVKLRELGLGACLADDMGLGKTAQWIAYTLYLRQTGQLKKPMLLLCPTSVLGNWQRELERFAPDLRVYMHYGANRAKGEPFTKEASDHDIVLTTYTTALRDRKWIEARSWDSVTLDEAQYIKNSGTQLTRFVRTLDAGHRLAMTGTPIENRLSELWSIMSYINPGLLGSERAFRSAFVQPIERLGDDDAAAKLSTIIKPFLLRRLKTDSAVITDLPEKLELTSYCTLSKQQAELYDECMEELFAALRHAAGMTRRGLILSAITKLKQICNDPSHALKERAIISGRSEKLTRLEELLAESIEAGDKAIVFTQFAAWAAMLKPYLSEKLQCGIGLLIGRTPRTERERTVRHFQEDEDGPKVLLVSLKAGGFGLNLTRASRVIHYDRWWNPAVERQATDRAYRIGQRRDVEVWKLIAKGTLEEAIDRLLQEKERLSEHIIGQGDRWLTEYGDEELKELLALRQEIVLEDERPRGGKPKR